MTKFFTKPTVRQVALVIASIIGYTIISTVVGRYVEKKLDGKSLFEE